MSMLDFAGALGGPGGAPPLGPGGGPPLGPGGGPPDAGPTAPPDNTQGGQYSTSLDALDGAEEALRSFIHLDPDNGDRAVAAACLQNVLKLKASNQQDSQQGGMKSLQRALAGTAGAAGAAGAVGA